MFFNDRKEFDDPQVLNPKGISIGSMDFDNPKKSLTWYFHLRWSCFLWYLLLIGHCTTLKIMGCLIFFAFRHGLFSSLSSESYAYWHNCPCNICLWLTFFKVFGHCTWFCTFVQYSILNIPYLDVNIEYSTFSQVKYLLWTLVNILKRLLIFSES